MDSIALRLQDDKENGMENFFIKSTFFTYNLNYYSNKVSTRKGDARLREHDNARNCQLETLRPSAWFASTGSAQAYAHQPSSGTFLNSAQDDTLCRFLLSTFLKLFADQLQVMLIRVSLKVLESPRGRVENALGISQKHI